MSALAAYTLSECTVSGSDIRFNALMKKLRGGGAYVYEGRDGDIAASASAVVYTSAIKSDDSELAAARNAGVPCVKRSEYLASVAAAHGKCVAVGGIHGKSTTTALLAAVFKNAGMSFSAHVGAEAVDIGGNYFGGGRDLFVTEACEYMGSFLTLEPDVAVVLNVEMDHPDCYENENCVSLNFRRFAERIKKGGTLVVNADEKYAGLYAGLDADVVTFGIEKGDYSARNVRPSPCKGRYMFDFFIGGEYVGEVDCALSGAHNIYNALACAAAALLSGADRRSVLYTLENFRGVKRRFERIGRYGGCEIISDYAHHPSEIGAVVKSARETFGGKVSVCFQPHTYSRTAKLFEEFKECFADADALVLYKEYSARETPDCGRSAYDLYEAMREYSVYEITGGGNSKGNSDVIAAEYSACGESGDGADGIAEGCRSCAMSDGSESENNPRETGSDGKKTKPSVLYAGEINELRSLIRERAKDSSCILLLGAGDMAEDVGGL